MKRFPWISLSLAGLALAAQLAGPELAAALEWRRSWPSEGQFWRAITGHLVHWSWQHFIWDWAALLALGGWAETRSRRRFLATLSLTCLLGEAALRWGGAFGTYRGLSAWGMGLFALGALELWWQARVGRDRVLAGVAAFGLVALVGKLLFELLAGEALFVSAASSGFEVAVESHVAGVAAALGVGALRWLEKRWACSSLRPSCLQ